MFCHLESMAIRLVRTVTPTRMFLARVVRRGRGERGQAMVELAIVAPVLLLLVLGILYFGRYMNYGTDATHLANEAARWAAVNASSANVGCSAGTPLAACVQSQTNSTSLRTGTGDITQKLKVCISFPNGATQGQPVRAEVTASFQLLPILGGTLPIDETAYMPLEQTPTNVSAGCSS